MSDNDIKGEKNNSSTSEKKEKVHDGYVRMYKCGKNLLHSTYERACAAYETTISQMKEIVEILNSEIKQVHSTNQGMQNYIDICHKESEVCAAKNTVHFENVANITINSDILITQ